ncbi:MAG: class I SAM-dependent methyltransferase [Desulfobacterales bacterium]|jgi:ubiquinone/menaquinone biosynthesis C-methylase UbiE
MANKDHQTGSARKDWNLRAREDFRNAIMSTVKGEKGEEEFRRTGVEDAKVISSFFKGRNMSDWRVLEYGCGVGRLMEPLSRRFGKIHGIDISDEMVKLGRQRLKGSQFSFHVLKNGDLPFSDGSFDLVYSMHVFQHMPKSSFRRLMPEIARVLKPGGLFLFHIMYPYTLRRKLQAVFGVDQLSFRQFISVISERGQKRVETYRRRYYTHGQIEQILGHNGMRLVNQVRRGPKRRYLWNMAERA